MFGLFKKADPVKVVDRVWLTSVAKWKACAAMLRANPDFMFVTWFENTVTEVRGLLGKEAPVFAAHEVNQSVVNGKLLIILEHYPLVKVERDFFERLLLKEVHVLSALDEPLFMRFGGERMIELMKQLGIGEDEILGHEMISSSIKRAQQKISQKVVAELKAPSQKKWFTLNFPA